MLRPQVMREMALLEFAGEELAAASWFARMSSRERQAYVKAHPRSKYAKDAGGVLQQQAENMSSRHFNAGTKARERADRLEDRGKSGGAAHKHYNDMANLHGAAREHYRNASAHFTSGNHKAGNAALQAGHAAAAKAQKLHAAHKARTVAEREKKAGERTRSNTDAHGRANKMLGIHSQVAREHHDNAKDAGSDGARAYHEKMAGHHNDAASHYHAATEHFSAGNHREGHAALRRGDAHARKAGATYERRKMQNKKAKAKKRAKHG